MAGGHTTNDTHKKRGAIFMASLTLRTCCNDNIQNKKEISPICLSVGGECWRPAEFGGEIPDGCRLGKLVDVLGFIELTLL